MVFRTYIPSAPLAAFVEMFWLFEGYSPGAERERVLPTGTMELVINLGEDATRVYDNDAPSRCETRRGAIVCGTYSRYFVIDAAEQAHVMGVHFRPGGAFPFLRPPAGELVDLHVDLEDVWGPTARTLRERLLECPTPEAKFRVLEREMLARASHPLARHPAVAVALRDMARLPHETIIARTAERANLSSRRFIEVFRREVGLTPKLFCRIGRFQRLVARLHATPGPVDWAELADEMGYFDQSHFIRELGAFTGLTPTRYLAERGQHLNHVPF